jgi:hypothetical protein
VLLLVPEKEGTTVRLAKGIREVEVLLRNGSTLGETVIPLTRPRDARQLTLFPD